LRHGYHSKRDDEHGNSRNSNENRKNTGGSKDGLSIKANKDEREFNEKSMEAHVFETLKVKNVKTPAMQTEGK